MYSDQDCIRGKLERKFKCLWFLKVKGSDHTWFTDQTQPQKKLSAAREECLSIIPHLGLYTLCLQLHLCWSLCHLQQFHSVEEFHRWSSAEIPYFFWWSWFPSPRQDQFVFLLCLHKVIQYWPVHTSQKNPKKKYLSNLKFPLRKIDLTFMRSWIITRRELNLISYLYLREVTLQVLPSCKNVFLLFGWKHVGSFSLQSFKESSGTHGSWERLQQHQAQGLWQAGQDLVF